MVCLIKSEPLCSRKGSFTINKHFITFSEKVIKIKGISIGKIALLIALICLPLTSGWGQATAPTSLSVNLDDSYVIGPSLTYLEDTERSLTMDDIMRPEVQARFSPIEGKYQSMNFGTTRSALWFRITIHAQPDAAKEWLLEASYPPINHIDLYVPRANGGWERKTSGDLVPFNERPFRHYNHVFPVELVPGTMMTFYLRVESIGALALPLKLWRPEALRQSDQKSYALFSLYFGLLLGLLLYNLLLYFSLHDRLYLIYVLFVASMGLGQLGLTGFGAQFLWPQSALWTHMTNPLAIGACCFFASIFTRDFLSTKTKLPRIDKVMIAIAILSVLMIILGIFINFYSAWLINVTLLVFIIMVFIIAIFSLIKGHHGARYFLLAWTALLLGTIVLALRNIGELPSNILTANAVLIGSALEMLLLSFALADRINLMRREKEAAQEKALAIEQSMVETLQQSERLLETRVAERTLALEEANKRLQDSQQLLKELAHHDPLTGLANRLLFIDRLSVVIQSAKRSGSVFALLMVDLNCFKAINDTYGHSAGDMALVEVAKRLKSSVRESDTVARIGGDEFVFILESITSVNDIKAMTDKIAGAITQPIMLRNGESVNVGISVGAAFYPQHGSDPERLINAADQAMYESKKSGILPVLA